MNRKILKDALFGAVGGAVGTLALGAAMGFLSRLQSSHDKWIERELVPEAPTEALAKRVSRSGLGIELSRERKKQFGKIVQFGYGISWGAIYALMRRRVPASSKFAGLPFGVGFGVFGSAFLLPTFKLTPSAKQFPMSTHVRGLLAHCAYAATVETVINGLTAVDHAITDRTSNLTKGELREVA